MNYHVKFEINRSILTCLNLRKELTLILVENECNFINSYTFRVRNKYCPANTKEEIDDITKDLTPDSIDEEKKRCQKLDCQLLKGDTNMNTQVHR